MSSELDYLTEEEIKTIKEIYPKSESTNEGEKKENPKEIAKSQEVPEVDTVPKKEEEGYTDYEKKTKESDRLTFIDSEIEITEEDIE